MRNQTVIFISKDTNRKPFKILLKLAKKGNGDTLKEAVQQETGIHVKNLRVFEVFNNEVHKTFEREDSISMISQQDTIIVNEVLDAEQAGERVAEFMVSQRAEAPTEYPSKCAYCQKTNIRKRCLHCLRVAYCNRKCQKSDWSRHRRICWQIPEPVGFPFIISLPQSQATYARISLLLETFARYSVNIYQPPPKEIDTAKEACSTDPISHADLDVVIGRLQSVEAPFTIHVCDQYSMVQGEPLTDLGDTPLKLDNVRYLVMDWKNSGKSTPFGLVESKPFPDMVATKTLFVSSHSLSYRPDAMKSMHEHQRNGVFTDFNINVTGKVINCHKFVLSSTCPYFEALLNSNMKEAQQGEVRIDNMDYAVLNAIIQYLYANEMTMKWECMQDAIDACELLQLPSLKEQLAAHICANVSVNDCISWCRVAEKYNLANVNTRARHLMCSQFEDVSRSDEFKCLTLPELVDYINNADIKIENRDPILAACMGWVSHDQSSRKDVLLDLLKHINIERCTSRAVSNMTDHKDLITDPNLMKFIYEKVMLKLKAS